MNHLEETEKAYLAGVVDTECHLGITVDQPKHRPNPRYDPILRLTMIDPDVVWWVHEITGVGSVHLLPRESPRHNIWLWAVVSRELEELLGEILPYLVLKWEVAGLILEFIQRLGSTNVKSEDEHSIRQNIIIRIRQLNQANRLDKQYGIIGQRMEKEHSLVAQRQSP